MHRIFIALINIALFSTCSHTGKKPSKLESPVSEGLKVGDRAPELAYQNPDGEAIALSSLRGKLVLIDFWASWCAPCRLENPYVVET